MVYAPKMDLISFPSLFITVQLSDLLLALDGSNLTKEANDLELLTLNRISEETALSLETGCMTVMLYTNCAPPLSAAVQVTVQVPTPTALMKPAELTVTIDSLSEVQSIAFLDAFCGLMVGVSVLPLPTSSVIALESSVIEETAFRTVIWQEARFGSSTGSVDFARIVTVPALCAVICPVSSMLAMLLSLEVQITSR